MRAKQIVPLFRCVILAMCSGVAIPLCAADCGKTSERAANLALAHSPTSILMLAKEIQGKKIANRQGVVISKIVLVRVDRIIKNRNAVSDVVRGIGTARSF